MAVSAEKRRKSPRASLVSPRLEEEDEPTTSKRSGADASNNMPTCGRADVG
jgi:hypothetical protein